MAEPVTWDMLRELAGFRAEKGCAISVFLNLDPSLAPTQPDVATRINATLAAAQRRLEESRQDLSREAREGTKADLEGIRVWLESDFDRDGAQGAAVFAAGPDGLFRPLSLVQPVADEARIGADLYLAPLARLAGKGDGALVAYVGRERAEVYRLRGGQLQEIADQSEEVPGQHDQGGWSQARYERHIETVVERHLRRVADVLDGCVRRRRGVRVVLVGNEEIRSEFEGLLSTEVREALAGWTSAERHASAAELLEAARPVLEQDAARAEQQLLERWREAAGTAGRASSGWEGTLEAASDGRVEILLVQDGSGREAYRCPECGRVQASDGACPLDGTAMAPGDGFDLAVHRTLAFGGKVHVVTAHEDLAPVEGIGALLRF